jgi:hypothetical protein
MIKEKLKEAGVQDIYHIISRYIFPIPMRTLIELIRDFIELIRDFMGRKCSSQFVDWKFRDWTKKYYKLSKYVELPYGNTKILLPQVLIFDNTKGKLGLSSIHFSRLKDSFKLNDEIRILTEGPFKRLLDYFKKKNITIINEDNLRLINIKKRRSSYTYSSTCYL